MKKLLVVMLAALSVAVLGGCAEITGDMIRMAQTSHDAGSCDGFKGRTKIDVETALQLKPEQAIEDGKTTVAQYEKGNFGAAVVYVDGKVSKYFCGKRIISGTLYRQYFEALGNGEGQKLGFK